MIDYLVYIIVRIISRLFIALPVGFSLFFARVCGFIFYYASPKKRSVVYKNLRLAFSDVYSPRELKKIAKRFYKNFAQNVVETLIVPKIDAAYIRHYVQVENLHYIDDAIRQGKGAILLSFHFGNWEISHATCSLLGYGFAILVKPQKRFRRLSNLLTLYRQDKGCEMIETGMATREIIRRLKNNQLIGMVADQSGKEGMLIPFLSRNASFPTGAMRFALKLKATIIPAFTIRQKGPYHKIILEEPLQLEPTDSEESNIYDSVTKIKTLAEKYVRLYPEQYFWFYKVWKYSDQRSVIVLSDGRVGHLRQLEAILKILQDSKYKIKAEVVEINFKSKFAKLVLNLFAMFSKSAPYSGNFRYLKWFLKKDSYQRLVSLYADMVVSCGSSLSSVNRLLASQNNARSVVIMKPGLLSLKRFGLVIIPKHDNPPLQDNVVVTKGALNLIDAEYLKNHSEKLQSKIMLKDNKIKIGLLLGGDNRGFVLKREPIKEIIGQIKSITAQLDAELLITTSRRTSSEIEELVKSEFKDYAPCKLLVIANETNIPEAVGGILGLSQIVILSADSISMISEAASSGKYVVVFDTQDCCAQLSKRHARFLKELSHEGYINFVDYRRISDTLKDIHKKKPAIKILNDKEVVKESLLRLL